MRVTHTHQETTNRLLEYSDNQGSLKRIFVRKYLSEDVGALFEHVQSVLYKAKRPLLNTVDFTLVNLYCVRTGVSHGYCPPPPKEVIFPATTLTLTFALTRKYYNVDMEYDPQFKVRYPEYSYMWGEDLHNRHNYFTISILIPKALRWGLRTYLYDNKYCYYLYNVLSMLTKNNVRNQYTYPFLDNMHNNHAKFFNLPYPDLIKRFTWKHLPFNKFVWFKATNLLTMLIDYNVTLFYFLYIHNLLPIEDRVFNDKLRLILYSETNSIVANLRQSIDNYNKNREKEDLILVASLFGMMYNDRLYYNNLRKIHYTTSLNLQVDDAETIIMGDINVYTLGVFGQKGEFL